MSEWKRFETLQQQYRNQYGDSAAVGYASQGGTAVSVATNIVKWQGDLVDVNPWRLYLGPWQPKPDITIGAGVQNYATPSLWAGSGTPVRFDRFLDGVQVYGKLYFGSGGQRHEAWVDWPRRGALVQVSGSYVQLDAAAFSRSGVSPNFEANLPQLAATLAPEPGGGDAAAPATYTYTLTPFRAADIFTNFQIPPFARSFQLLLDPTSFPAGMTDVLVEVLSSLPGSVIASYDFPIATTPPTDYQTVLPVPAGAGDIRVTFVGATAPIAFGLVTLSFLLDL